VATVAYDTTTGAQMWAARYDGSAHDLDNGDAIAVSPDGRFVYVGGLTTSLGQAWDYLTIAYDARSGARAWLTTADDSLHRFDLLYALRVSPDGSRVFVTGVFGESTSPATTIAYDAATGHESWRSEYSDANGTQGYDIAVNPDGQAVTMSGSVGSAPEDAIVVQYDAATGAQRWVARYDGPGHGADAVTHVAMSPDGSVIYGSGWVGAGANAVTLALQSSSGKLLWASIYDGPAHLQDQAIGLVVVSDGSKVATVDFSETPTGADIATVVDTASDGSRVWVATYDDGSNDYAAGVAAAPDGSALFVTGSSQGGPGGWDYVTIAYPL
jgi:PQQ-like domain